VGERTGVEHDAAVLGARLLDEGDHRREVVGLLAVDGVAVHFGGARRARHVVGQRHGAVHRRLASAEHVEVRPVQKKQSAFCCGHEFRVLRGRLAQCAQRLRSRRAQAPFRSARRARR